MKRHLLNYCLIISGEPESSALVATRYTAEGTGARWRGKEKRKQTECKWNKNTAKKACIFAFTLSRASAPLVASCLCIGSGEDAEKAQGRPCIGNNASDYLISD